ncbi:MAG: S-layer homology domain-containing protein [Clostridia bacterium]|nr:S-layer homology domain-containing protein [Clostridia bacterium]
MKRILSVLLCLALCFEGVSVFAYTDYSDMGEEYKDATDILSNLKIMEGFEDGTFRPDDTLTRAEAAAIMVRLLGKDNWVPEGETRFTDVESTHWAAEYIYRAEANGIVNGMGDGTFEPDSTVTYHQFVKMLVCILGYKPIAERFGGWLGGGYLYVGSSQVLGFTKGVPGKTEEPVTRMTAARLVYNSLAVEMLDKVTLEHMNNGGLYCSLDYETLIEDYLGCELIVGVITETGNRMALVEILKNSTRNDHYVKGQKYIFEDETRNGRNLEGYTVIAYVQKTDEGNRIIAVRKKEE